MNIGSLFVELGVKGSSEAIRGVGSLGKGLRDVAIIANQSLQFMSKLYGATKEVIDENTRLGNSLLVASKDLDISTNSLQRWEYASMLSGARAGEMTSAFKSLQGSLLSIRDNDVPEYFAYLFQQMGEVDKSFDTNRFLSGDVEYAMESIRKLAKNGTYDLARLNKALSSLGFSEGISNFLKFSDVDLKSISKDLVISDKNVKNLDEMYQGMVKIEQISKVAFADIAAVFDKQFINEIGSLVKELTMLLKEVVVLAKDSGLIGGTAKIATGTAGIIKRVRETPVNKSTGSVTGDFFGGISNIYGGLTGTIKDLVTSKGKEGISPAEFIINTTVNVPTNDPFAIGDAVNDSTQEAINNTLMQTGGSR